MPRPRASWPRRDAGRCARPSGWSATCGPAPSSASSCSSGSRSTHVPDLAKDPKFSRDSTARWSPPTCGRRSTCSWKTSSGARRPTSASSCSPTSVYLNGRLAKFYGADLPADAPFQKVSLDEPERAGRADASVPAGRLSPTRRPARRSIAACSWPGACWAGRCGRRPKPSRRCRPTCTPDSTTRERVHLQTSPTACHDLPRMINPLGFAARELRRRRPVPREGEGQADRRRRAPTRRARARRSVQRRPRAGRRSWPAARRPTTRLSSNCSITWSSSRSGRSGRKSWPTWRSFAEHHEYNIRKLMVEIVASSALTPRAAGPKALQQSPWPWSTENVRFRIAVISYRIPLQLHRHSPETCTWPRRRNRREFHPRPGHRRGGPAVRPEPAEPGLRQPADSASSGWSSCSAPTASSPRRSGPTRKARTFTLKESLKPLEPFQNRTLILHGVCDKVRGDGDNHMRGIGCLLTGIELFPGNIQGGSRHAGRLGERHLDRPGDQELPAAGRRPRAPGSARSSSA